MKYSIYTKKKLTALSLLMILCLLLGIHSVYCIYYTTRFETPFAVFLFLLIFLVLILTAAFKLFEELTERIMFTDEELISYYLFHENFRIRWDEIEEIGVGQIYTPRGTQFCVYFSRSPLSYEEMDNLQLASKKCIYMQKLTRENFERVSRYCPPEELTIVKRWVIDGSL